MACAAEGCSSPDTRPREVLVFPGDWLLTRPTSFTVHRLRLPMCDEHGGTYPDWADG